MLIVGSLLLVADNSGLVLVSCIKILGNTYKKTASIGDILIVSVKKINPKSFFFKKKKKRINKYCKGSLHRAFLLRVKKNFSRSLGVYIKFSDNSVILVNKKNVPLGKRIKGPVLIELCYRYPTIGNLSQCIV